MRKLLLFACLVLLAAFSAQAQTCRGRQVLTEPRGTFDDGSGRSNYSNNLDCQWLIQPPGARLLRLEFLNFATEWENDVVTIYDGPTTESPILGQFSGRLFEQVVLYTTQGSALVTFRTNARETYEGWTLDYRSLDERPSCEGQRVFFASHDTIEVGSPYTANLDCEWLLNNPYRRRTRLRIDFERFRTEANADFVEIYAGSDRQAPRVARFSGTRLPDRIEFEAETALITFRTDDKNQDQGWRLNFEWIEPDFTCQGTVRLTAPSGVIEDGSGPNPPYAPIFRANCEWLIEPPGARFLRLDFDEFDLTGFGSAVEIYDGLGPNADRIAVFNDFNRPNAPIFTTGGAARITFSTGNFDESGQGWRLRYRSVDTRPSCSGRREIQRASGEIEDGSGPENYSNNLDCEWLLLRPWSNDSTRLRITFSEFRTQARRDVLEIYEGSSRDRPPLATFSGTQLPDTFEAETGTEGFLLVFRTDGSVTDAGWRLRFEWREGERTCRGTTRLTEPEGIFDDGSGPDRPYSSFLNCEWIIEPPAARFLRLDFEEFDLSFGASVAIYDDLAPDAQPIARFEAFLPPTEPIFTRAGVARIVFENFGGSEPGLGWTLRYRSIDERPTCSGRQTFSDPDGEIEDGSGPGDYSNDLNCQWLLQSPTWMVGTLRIEFDEFRTQAGRDVVEIYQGFEPIGQPVATFSGTRLPEPLELTTQAAVIVFRTDGSVTDAGWRLRFEWREPEPTCQGQTRLTAPSGTFDDGSGPEADFTPGLNCEWLIEPAGARFVRLEFTAFDLGFSGGVVYVFDGATRDAEPIGIYYSGERPRAPLFTSGGAALVVFENDFGGAPGWTLSYEGVDRRPSCSGRRIVTGYSGVIEDGSGPNDYDNDLDCEWVLVNPYDGPSPLRIEFEQLDIDLILDLLTIHDGIGRNGRILGTYFGNRLPPPLEVEVEDGVTIVFRTNRTRTAAGWRLRFAWPTPDGPSCSGRQVLTEREGEIADRPEDFGLFYTNNLECEWLIAPPGASVLDLRFEYFDTHSPADYVEIYRGDQAREADRLLRHSGRSVPPPLQVPGGVALVRFVTDGSGVSYGWSLAYTAGGTGRGQTAARGQLVLYPNPATDRCILRWPATEPARLTVVDAAGRVIEAREVETSVVELDVANWASGLYALHLRTASGALYTGRLLKP